VRVSTAGAFVDFTPTSGAPMAATAGFDGNMYALIADQASACSLQRFGAQGHSTIAVDPSVLAVSCTGLAAGADGRLWTIGQRFPGSAFETVLVAVDPLGGASTVYRAPQLVFNFSQLAAGPDNAIWYNAPPSAMGRFDLGGGPARAYVTPSVAGFAPTPPGQASGAHSIVVRSTGTAPLAISSVSLTGPDAGQFVIDDQCSGRSLPPGAACTVLVASTPTATGTHVATLVVRDNDVFSPQHVRLEEFTLPPTPTVTPPSLAFPTTIVGQQSATTTVTLTNPMDRALSVQFVSLGGANASDFVVIDDHCSSTTVAAGGTCTVRVAFKPGAAGTRS